MNGKYEVRLERIELSLAELHEKVDGMVETGAVNKADIVWLKWGFRLLLVGNLGLRGLTVPSILCGPPYPARDGNWSVWQQR